MLVSHTPLSAFRFTGLPLWASLLSKNKLPSLSGSLSGPPLDAACSSLFCFFVPSACAYSSEVAVTSCSPIPFVSLRGILNQRSLSVSENARQQPCKTEDPPTMQWGRSIAALGALMALVVLVGVAQVSRQGWECSPSMCCAAEPPRRYLAL